MSDLSASQLPTFTNNPIHILALPGSLRRGSFNRLLCEAASEVAPAGVTTEVFNNLSSIPLFDEDLEAATEYGPEPVHALRRQVAHADGLLVSTPEYNQSLPGVLKNTLDWLSRPGPEEVLIGKPAAVIGASAGPWGTRLAQKELRHVLLASESVLMPQPMLFVRNAGDLFSDEALIDQTTRARLADVMTAFVTWIQRTSAPVPCAWTEQSLERCEA